MVDDFWDTHLSYSEVAKKLGTSRQNVSQRCKRGSIPCDRDQDGNPGIPLEEVKRLMETKNETE